MKIKIDQNHENDQPEENEAWREKFEHNVAIMNACIAAFPNRKHGICVWRILFDSIVPSASQSEAEGINGGN